MIDDKLAEKVKEALGLWLEQYNIPGDADRARRPEIETTIRLLEEINRARIEVRYQLQISSTGGHHWIDSQMAAHGTLEDARSTLSKEPNAPSWFKFSIMPVIYKDDKPLRFSVK